MTIARRQVALLAVLATWLPLALFSVAQMGTADVPGVASFWLDFGLHERFLISVPVLILADELCMPALWQIIDHFSRAGLVGDAERFAAAVASARRAFDSRAAFIVLGAIAWLAAAALARFNASAPLPAWHVAAGSSARLSAAGWWNVLVSLPVALLLVFGWFWRLAVWWLLLVRLARCRLRLMAAHPDRAAGLGFVGRSLGAFSPVAFAFSAMAAGRVTQLLMMQHADVMQRLYLCAGFTVFIMLMIVAPLCAFTPVLIDASLRGTLAYGLLAHRMGQAFERKWMTPDTPPSDEEPLDAMDFSATLDLYSIVGLAISMRLVPVARRNLLTLVGVTAIPFAPVLLAMVPVDVIWSELHGLFF